MKDNTESYCLIDCGYLTYFLINSNEQDLEKSFFYYLSYLNNELNIDLEKLIFCLDGTRNALYRRLEYPEYKKNREEKEKKLTYVERQALKNRKKDIFNLILKMEKIFNVFIYNGFEADDVIAYIIKKNPEKKFIIMANDSDLYQLLSANVKMYCLKKNEFFTENCFNEKYNIDVSKWAEIKAVCGDSADNIKGIDKVGIKTYIKYLNNELKGTKLDLILTQKEYYLNKNISLVKLPHSKIFKKNINLKIKKINLENKIKKELKKNISEKLKICLKYLFFNMGLEKKCLKRISKIVLDFNNL